MDDLREASKLAPDNSEIVCLLQRVKLESAIQSGEIQALNPIASKAGVNQIKNYSLDEEPILNSISSDLGAGLASSSSTLTAPVNSSNEISYQQMSNLTHATFNVKDTPL